MSDDDDLVNSQARARSLGFLGSHVENSEWLTTDLIVVCRMKAIIKMTMLLMLMTMVVKTSNMEY